MADDFYRYDLWLTTPPPDEEDRMTLAICTNGHHRVTRDPDGPCQQCQEDR